MSTGRPILYAEDDENDVVFFELACSRAGVTAPLAIVRNGQEAITWLSQAGSAQQPPCLVVTDLNMPIKDGFELLAWIQNQEHLKSVPVVVLSSSEHQRDRLRAFSLGARDYAAKPSGIAELVCLVRDLHGLWGSAPSPAQHTPAPAGARSARENRKPRILIRRGDKYLQPSGEWSLRATAREFATSTIAYWWAKEQALLGVEVLLAFDDPAQDYVPRRL